MLSIHKMSGSASGIQKYLDNAGYYTKSQGFSEFTGSLADEYNLSGKPVNAKVFEKLLEGTTPTGEDFTRSQHISHRRKGTDLTFSAPKSVSMALAIVPERMRNAILEDNRESVRIALKYIEDHVVSARYGKGGTLKSNTGESITAMYEHLDARPVDGVADIDLHIHALMLNITKDSEGLRSMDLDWGNENSKWLLADYIYKAELAKKLKERGFGIHITKDGFDLDGVTKEQISAFSRRTEAIKGALDEKGLTNDNSTSAERKNVATATREHKGEASEEDHLSINKRRIEEAGVNYFDMMRGLKEEPIEKQAQECVDSALRHFAENESVFSKDQVLLNALKSGIGDYLVSDMEKVLEEREDIIRASDVYQIKKGGANLITTEACVEREEWIKCYVAETASAHESLIDLKGQTFEEYVSAIELGQGFAFSEGQRNALQHALTSEDKLVGIVGSAGAGKTTSMKTIVDEAKSKGFLVVSLTPSHTAKNEVADAGADVNMTIAKHLAMQTNNADEHKPTYYILDEAGMVGDATTQAFMKTLRQEDRVLMSGDPSQVKPMEAGDTYKMLIDSNVLATSEINEVQRQKSNPELLKMTQAFADKDLDEGVKMLNDYCTDLDVNPPKELSKSERKDIIRQAIAEETSRQFLSLDKSERERTLIVCLTNDVRERVNTIIRDALKSNGELGEAQHDFVHLKRTAYTREERLSAVTYVEGQIVRSNEYSKELGKHVVDGKVVGVNTKAGTITLEYVDGTKNDVKTASMDLTKTQVYDVDKVMGLSVHDLLIMRDNSLSGAGIQNGDTAKIMRITNDSISIRTDKGKEVTIEANKLHGLAIDFGYARTVNDSQGKSIHRAIVTCEESLGAYANSIYVAITRAKHELSVITCDVGKLMLSVRNWANKQQAGETVKRIDDELSEKVTLQLESATKSARDKVMDLVKKWVPKVPEVKQEEVTEKVKARDERSI